MDGRVAREKRWTRGRDAGAPKEIGPRPEMAEVPGATAAPRLGLAGWSLIAAFYSAVTLIATYPVALTVRTKLPSFGITDMMQHLWVMRWYKHCLVGGTAPFLCPELQYPVGAPLGLFSPLQLQALLYLPLSLITKNDVLIYNLLWYFGFVFTGLGTFALSWRLTRDRAGSALAGVLAMLAAPVSLHAFGHLELMYVGGFPLFLAAWFGFVDRPNAPRLALALVGYIVLAMCAAYFSVFAVFPAALYVAWRAVRAWRSGERGWLPDRLKWFLAYAALAGAGLGVVFACHLWGVAHGNSLVRPRAEFDSYGAPLWGYLLPSWAHRLHPYLPFAPYPAAWGPAWAETAGERASYLGVVTLILLNLAAVRGVRFPRAGFLWMTLALLVVLSMGSTIDVGGRPVGLPAGWLRQHFFPFRLIRVPARFNLFVAVIAAVLAGAAFGDILKRLRTRGARAVLFAAVTAVAILDLAVGYEPTFMPARPDCYAEILRRDPGASFLEVPQNVSGGSLLNAATGYWQSLHQGRTSGGYSGHANAEFNRRLSYTSPFLVSRLADPKYLEHPESQPIDLLDATDFRDYAWLYLKAHGFRYAVLHRWPGATPETPNVRTDRLQAQLIGAQVYEDDATLVFDRDRLPEPANPAILCTEGWLARVPWRDRHTCLVGPVARASVFTPDPDRELTLTIEAAGFARPRVVRVTADGREIARWTVSPDGLLPYQSPPFRLPRGLSEIRLSSDGADEPRGRNLPPDGDRRPISLRVTRVTMRPSQSDDVRPTEADRTAAREPSRD